MAGIQKGWRRGETTFTNDNLFPPKKRWCISYSCSNKENETSFPLTLNSSMRQITCLLLMEAGSLLITNGRGGGCITVSVIQFWQILIW